MSTVLLGILGRRSPLIDAAEKIVAARAFGGKPSTLTTRDVANWFTNQCRGLDSTADLAPAATRSLALVSIAGDLPEPNSEVPDPSFANNTYQLYDLSQVATGSCVWRLSAKGQLNAFYREDNTWLRYKKTMQP